MLNPFIHHLLMIAKKCIHTFCLAYQVCHFHHLSQIVYFWWISLACHKKDKNKTFFYMLFFGIDFIANWIFLQVKYHCRFHFSLTKLLNWWRITLKSEKVSLDFISTYFHILTLLQLYTLDAYINNKFLTHKDF